MDDAEPTEAMKFEDLSDIERENLEQALEAGDLSSSLTVEKEEQKSSVSHGSIELATVLVNVAPATVAVVATWLLRFAPPKPVKRTIVRVDKKSGITTTETIEYDKKTPEAELIKRLEKALEASG